MKHYVVAELNVSDDSWVPSYLAEVTRLVEENGGRYLVRTPKIQKIEGERPVPQIFIIIEFPSKEAAVTFYSSAEYQPYLKARKEGASTEMVLVAGEDIALNK
ncbi:MAG: DUF1330 domain-containing protein [Nitrospirota bacterium]|nr:MAG: DUF1330 domain-containing protein [Nitrospirota bacterium]